MIIEIIFYTDGDLIVYANKKNFNLGLKEIFDPMVSIFKFQLYNNNTAEKDIAENKKLIYEFLNHISIVPNEHREYLHDCYESALKEFIALDKLTDFCYENGNQDFTFKIL